MRDSWHPLHVAFHPRSKGKEEQTAISTITKPTRNIAKIQISFVYRRLESIRFLAHANSPVAAGNRVGRVANLSYQMLDKYFKCYCYAWSLFVQDPCSIFQRNLSWLRALNYPSTFCFSSLPLLNSTLLYLKYH